MESKVEQYIEDYTRNCSNELCSVEDRYGKTVISYHEWLTPDHARSIAKIAREEIIDKAIKWIRYNNDNGGCLFDGWEFSFRMEMEE